jgi:uncharacterized membrane protein
MNFENPLFLLPILVGPIFIIAGIVMILFPPKKINYLYGYRTKNSMKNIDRWNFAQNYSAKIMIFSGFFFSLTSLIGMYIKGNEFIQLIIAIFLMLLLCGIVFYLTEKKLIEKFK